MKSTTFKPRRRIIQDEGPDPIDIHVGLRLRERRRQQSISLVELGKRIGVSFQAVQKYQNASMRISASTLYRLCQVLGVEPNYFFKGYVGSPSEAGIKRRKRGKR
jgi:transcriptional regulator with XRE-family HTH domain